MPLLAFLRGAAPRPNPPAPGTLRARLEALRGELAAAAQAVYEGWAQDADGLDVERGAGGICDGVAEALKAVVAERLDGVDLLDGGQQGDDHAWIVALTPTEAVAVDVPPGVYERGGGYAWRKRPGVVIGPADVALDPLPRDWFEDDPDADGG